jgi:hypothetical protein
MAAGASPNLLAVTTIDELARVAGTGQASGSDAGLDPR